MGYITASRGRFVLAMALVLIPVVLTALLPYLSSEQTDALTEAESDRAAWWAEVLSGLVNGITTPAVDGTSIDDRPTTLEDDRPTTLDE